MSFDASLFLCYCLFHVSRPHDADELLVALFYTESKRHFMFIAYRIAFGRVLVEINRFPLHLASIRFSRLAYSAHKWDASTVQVIFYERRQSAGATAEQKVADGHFALCTLDCERMRLAKEQCGVLPPGGRWQLPFVSGNVGMRREGGCNLRFRSSTS